MERDTSTKVNRKSAYRIHAQWLNPRTAELHIFVSDRLIFDQTDYIKNDEITVFTDKDNPQKYHVDLSFLPKVANAY